VLAFAVVAITDLDLALIGTYDDLQGDIRQPAMIRARQEARAGVGLVTAGFVLQFLGLVLSAIR
jgi:hypothetical protein